MNNEAKKKNVLLFLMVLFILGINVLSLFHNDIYAKLPTNYGYWGTSISCTPGTIVDWECYEGTPIECTVGETGKGFCPDH